MKPRLWSSEAKGTLATPHCFQSARMNILNMAAGPMELVPAGVRELFWFARNCSSVGLMTRRVRPSSFYIWKQKDKIMCNSGLVSSDEK